MKNPLVEIVRVIIALLMIAVGFAVYWRMVSGTKTLTQVAEPSRPPVVRTIEALAHLEDLEIEVDGTVVPHREIEVSAEVAGRIIFKSELCRAGKFVEQGTSMVEIDPLDYQLAVRRLSKEFEQAEATLEELDVEIANVDSLVDLAMKDSELQRKELGRTEALASSGVITDSQIDQERRDTLAATNILTTQMNERRLLDTRRGRLQAAREFVLANLEKAKLDLDRTKLESRVTGVIVKDMVEQGNYVQAGEVIYTIEDTSAVEVKCTLRTQQLYWLGNRPSQAWKESDHVRQDYQVPPTPATVIYEVEGFRYWWHGELTRFDGIGLDMATRTIPCRVIVNNPRDVHTDESNGTGRGPKVLVRGMYVTVVLHARPHETLVVIPENAIHPDNVIWRVVDNAILVEKVKVVSVRHGRALIVSDPDTLQVGDRVITSPIAGAYHGMAVKTSL